MWTALISGILGLVSGAVPKVLDIYKDKQAHLREVEFLKLQHGFQMEREKLGAESKMREAESNIMAEEIRAFREHLTQIITLQGTPTGIPWIDGFNAVLRPANAALLMLLFAWSSYLFIDGVMTQWGAGKVDGVGAAQLLWGSLIGETF